MFACIQEMGSRNSFHAPYATRVCSQGHGGIAIPRVLHSSAIRAQSEKHDMMVIISFLPCTCSTKASCPGQLYVGKEPYAWIDLSAGPSDYGPLAQDDVFHPPTPIATVTGTEARSILMGGSDPSKTNFGISGMVGFASGGQVFTNTLPALEHYGGARASVAQHRLLLPNLAALAASAVQQLAWPPVAHSKLAQVGYMQAPPMLHSHALQRNHLDVPYFSQLQ